MNGPELFEFGRIYQVHALSTRCWKYKKNECRFPYGHNFTEKRMAAKPLDFKFSNDDKQELLTRRN